MLSLTYIIQAKNKHLKDMEVRCSETALHLDVSMEETDKLFQSYNEGIFQKWTWNNIYTLELDGSFYDVCNLWFIMTYEFMFLDYLLTHRTNKFSLNRHELFCHSLVIYDVELFQWHCMIHLLLYFRDKENSNKWKGSLSKDL